MYLRFPIPLRFWLGTLNILNMAGVVLFEGTEVLAVAVIFFVSGILTAYMYQQLGFVKILGASHVLWPFEIAWLWFMRLPEIEDESLHTWLTVVVVINSLCFVLDVMDVIKYINGDRKPSFYWDDTTKERALTTERKHEKKV